ncbi:hypothetical protein SEA_AMOHNITION_48 [Mycobacterium phage Amohnition]|uniref:Uncharacterized protein n=1 Tax=Mycobacterium phage Amohnition TaxID=2015874 RepID=A0A222ZP85_9CAUD|nr:hypothetical protein I5G85_gp51 [Mycobacterium phage Amohnition]ASR86328.1 hypothetical protein SEA_AMOHNITION_48 [Mycobacterium phage Amohnition]
MSLARHIAAAARLRGELNEALRERDSARTERDAARLVVAEQSDALRVADSRITYLTGERDELDAAHRVALADLAEAHRELVQLRAVDDEAMGVTVYVDQIEAVTLHAEPDMDRAG